MDLVDSPKSLELSTLRKTNCSSNRTFFSKMFFFHFRKKFFFSKNKEIFKNLKNFVFFDFFVRHKQSMNFFSYAGKVQQIPYKMNLLALSLDKDSQTCVKKINGHLLNATLYLSMFVRFIQVL